MSFYAQHILPQLLDLAMRNEDMARERALLIPRASGVVLELGFGSGLNLPFYSQNVTRLYALDPSVELWNLAAERVRQVTFPVEFLQASAEQIPLPDKSVDTVVSTWTFCSIPKPELALREVKRVLKPGRRFIFIEHGHSPEVGVGRWQKRLTPLWTKFSGGCHLDRNMTELLHQEGFVAKTEHDYMLSRTPKIFRYLYKGTAQAN